MPINTHRTYKNLREAGADDRLAEAITNAVSEANEEVVTKSDLRGLETAFRSDLDNHRSDLDNLELRLEKKMAEMGKRLEVKIKEVEGRIGRWVALAAGVLGLLQVALRFL